MTTSTQEEGKEREQQPEVVLAEILKKHQENRAEQQEAGPEWLTERLSSLPIAARVEVQKFDANLEEDGLSQEARAKYIDREIDRFNDTYVEQRFTVGENNESILKEAYSKQKAIEWMKDLFDEEPSSEDLARIARLSFDANGLKAMNDLSASHETGTEYLKRVADVVYESAPIKARMSELGITDIIPVTGGGDEYSIIVKADKLFSPEDLSDLTKKISREIEELDVSDLINFDDLDTQLRYLGMTKKEFIAMDDATKEETLSGFRDDFPEDFKMRASAPGGAATLLEGMRSALGDAREGKRLTAGDSYQRALEKMMGGMWDASDAIAMEKKNEYKAALANSESSDDKFYSRVLKRTSEAQQLEKSLGEKTERLAKQDERVRKIKELVSGDTALPEAALAAIKEMLAQAE